MITWSLHKEEVDEITLYSFIYDFDHKEYSTVGGFSFGQDEQENRREAERLVAFLNDLKIDPEVYCEERGLS